MTIEITKQMVMGFGPCYSEELIDWVAAGRESITETDIDSLDIPWEDKIWLASRLMSIDQACNYARRVALDVADLWGCPDVCKRWLETGDPGLLEEAYWEAWSAPRPLSRGALGAAETATKHATRAAVWGAGRTTKHAIQVARYAIEMPKVDLGGMIWVVRDAALWSAAWAANASDRDDLYLTWAIETLSEGGEG